MQLAIDQKDIDKFLMVGDKVLIKPKNPQSQTKSGLYLPPTVQQEKIPRVRNMKYGKRKQRVRCIIFLCRRMKAIWLYFYRMRLTRSILMKRSS
mgnify:CR=1 FL=1